MATVQVSEEQVRWFRARRLHLVGQGAATPEDAASRLLGAQAQVEAQALLGLSQRTASRPDAATLDHQLNTARTLVRCWGQRDTMHLYSVVDWPLIIAARPQWTQSGRRFPSPPPDAIAAALDRMQRLARPVTREDLFDLTPPNIVKQWQTLMPTDEASALRFATGRFFWELTRAGHACAAGKLGSQQQYVARTVAFPDLPWDLPDADAANTSLTRRYLALSGPATPADVGYHFGASVTAAKAWLAPLRGELVDITCGPRKGLLALQADVDALRAPITDWPLRLLPSYDMKWMSHKDKSWVTPNKADEKRVWRKAAVVAACVVHRGQPVANWTVTKRAKHLDIALEPLSGWSPTLLPAVQAEAQHIAAHYGRDEVTVTVD